VEIPSLLRAGTATGGVRRSSAAAAAAAAAGDRDRRDGRIGGRSCGQFSSPLRRRRGATSDKLPVRRRVFLVVVNVATTAVAAAAAAETGVIVVVVVVVARTERMWRSEMRTSVCHGRSDYRIVETARSGTRFQHLADERTTTRNTPGSPWTNCFDWSVTGFIAF